MGQNSSRKSERVQVIRIRDEEERFGGLYCTNLPRRYLSRVAMEGYDQIFRRIVETSPRRALGVKYSKVIAG